MGNTNLKAARKAAEKSYKNIDIELIPHDKSRKPDKGELDQCAGVRIYNKKTGKLIKEEVTGHFRASDFENLFDKEDLKLSFLDKDLETLFDNTPVENLFNTDYEKEINACIELSFADTYLYSEFQDKKDKSGKIVSDKFIPSFCAYFGLWEQNKKIYFKLHNESFCKNNPSLNFNGNEIHTYDEISKRYDFGRERARQIIDIAYMYFSLRFLINFEEVIHKIKFILNHKQNYIILKNAEELTVYETLLNELFDDYGESAGFYINLSIGLIIKNNITLDSLLDDETIPYDIKRKLEEHLNKISIYINGERILCKKKNLIEYYVKTYCKTPTKLSDIQKLYKKMLVENNLGNRTDLIYDDRSLDNMLAGNHNILLSLGKEYRYYESEKMDALAKLLNLNIYQDVIISANKVYEDNLDLMKEYDIRNAYELHNLLNKKTDDCNIVFKKMPTICFGKADRDSQVLELLKKLSPVSAKNLAEVYANKYGDAEDTILGSYFNSIAKYKIGNEYIYN